MSSKLFLVLCLLAFIVCEDTVFEVNLNANALNTFSVKKGKEFKIKLAGNPTTGYSWFLLNLEALTESNAVANVDTNEDGSAGGYVSSVPEGESLPGAGGDFYFTLKAVAKTSEPIDLLFSYQRPWEANNAANSVTVKINVE